MENQFQLSIIIVNHRTEDVLPGCLNSIAECRTPFEYEVVIVDNPASYAELGFRTQYPFPVKTLSTPRRVGFARASNMGAAQAEGAYLLFLNPDISLSDDAINELYHALVSDPQIGLVTGRLTYPDGRFQPSCRYFPNLSNLVFSRGSLMSRFYPGRARRYTLPDFDEPTEVEAAAAAMVMISSQFFDELNGFDERFPLYLEDTDLCLRIHQKHKKVLFIPSAGAIHLWGYATRHYRFRRIIWHHLSMWHYFFKHRKTSGVLVLSGPLLIVNCLLSLVIELFSFRR